MARLASLLQDIKTATEATQEAVEALQTVVGDVDDTAITDGAEGTAMAQLKGISANTDPS